MTDRPPRRGFPDWRKADSYLSEENKLSLNEWRWQFLRRLEKYRAVWEKRYQDYPSVTAYYDHRFKSPATTQKESSPPPPDPQEVRDLSDRFGIDYLPDPSVGDLPTNELPFRYVDDVAFAWDQPQLLPYSTIGPYEALCSVDVRFSLDEQLSNIKEQIESNLTLSFLNDAAVSLAKETPDRSEEIDAKFEDFLLNLAKPTPKLEEISSEDPDIQNIIKIARESRDELRSKGRRTRTNWSRYLRIMDARDQGASWTDIAKALWPMERNSNKAKDNAKDKARKSYDQAMSQAELLIRDFPGDVEK
jgi:hypothetical protein